MFLKSSFHAFCHISIYLCINLNVRMGVDVKDLRLILDQKVRIFSHFFYEKTSKIIHQRQTICHVHVNQNNNINAIFRY